MMPAKTPVHKAPTAAMLLAVLNRYQPQLNGEWGYTHIQPFTLAEAQDFLAGKPGVEIPSNVRLGGGYTRSHQVKQALHAIGAYVVDRKKADDETVTVYKGVWDIQNNATCPYCGKGYKFALMMSDPRHCTKARCILGAMRERI
jgi:hypothetical protein